MKLINFNDAWYNLDKLLYITDIFLYTYDGMGTVIKERIKELKSLCDMHGVDFDSFLFSDISLVPKKNRLFYFKIRFDGCEEISSGIMPWTDIVSLYEKMMREITQDENYKYSCMKFIEPEQVILNKSKEQILVKEL